MKNWKSFTEDINLDPKDGTSNYNIWLSVDNSEPITFQEFYDDNVEQLTPEDFEQVRNMEIGDMLGYNIFVDEIGVDIGVERVPSSNGSQKKH